MKAFNLPTKKRSRGNPDWFTLRPARVLPTAFETEVARLGLTKAQFVGSAALKRWCEHHRNRVYVPEWLLGEWGMHVEMSFSEVA